MLLDPPVAGEVQGLRRALGDGSLAAIGPHLTLVPPLNIAEGQLGDVLATVRSAAAAEPGPISLVLGPVLTFVPASPVLYLGAGGSEPSQLAALDRLAGAVLQGPLGRPRRWPWVPHVTVCDEVPGEEHAAAAVRALASYRTNAVFDRAVLLEQQGTRWSPLADAALGPAAVVGRGGIELEIVRGRAIGPDGAALVRGAGGELPPGAAEAPERIVLTGLMSGGTIGLAVAWWQGIPGSRLDVCVFVAPRARRQGIGRALLSALESAVGRAGWSSAFVGGHGPPEFFANSSAWVREFVPPGSTSS